MFTTVSTPQELQKIQERLTHLHPNSLRTFGTLEPNEMLYHLRAQQESALGEVPNPPLYKNALNNIVLKWLFIYLLPWPKGVKTAKAFNAKKQLPHVQNLEQEKVLFIQKLEAFIACKHLHPHPLFGHLSKPMWDRMVWRHIQYHFKQFGV